MVQTRSQRIVVIGGGTAGITVAAWLRRRGAERVQVIEPSPVHYYQPLWTLVGGGQVDARSTVRPTAKVMPKGVDWVQDAVTAVEPEADTVVTASGRRIGYDVLVVAPGIQLDFDAVPGLAEGIAGDGIASNYRFDLAPKTWDLIRNARPGSTAVFTMPSTPIKCGGAPQKIAYLAADYWRRKGQLDSMRVVLSLPTPTIFGQPDFARVLEGVVARYGIEVRLDSEAVEVDPDAREVTLADTADGTKERIGYDLMHVTPPQSAPAFLKGGPLSDPADPLGWVTVDKHTLRHTRYPNVWSLGDASNLPTSKTGAAVRKQAPTLVKNLLAVLDGREPTASYDGYTSCPLVTSRSHMLLAEFDYDKAHTPSFPVIDLVKERRSMYLLKRYGLPLLYWQGMLKGRA